MNQPETPKDLKHVTCPQCGKDFVLDYFSGRPTLKIRDCPSGGIYDVSIRCPHCNYEEEL